MATTAEQAIRYLEASSNWPQADTNSLVRFIDPGRGANQSPSLEPMNTRTCLRALFDPAVHGGRFITLGRKVPIGVKSELKLDCATVPLTEALCDGFPLHDYNLVVPNLASMASGHTREGKPSCRALEMYPERHYLVTECDAKDQVDALQFQILYYIARMMKRSPVMVVHSGNKSLHAWWRVDGLSEAVIKAIFDTMHPLLDRSTLVRNQLVRIPQGMRAPGEKNAGSHQYVLYYNPNNQAYDVWTQNR